MLTKRIHRNCNSVIPMHIIICIIAIFISDIFSSVISFWISTIEKSLHISLALHIPKKLVISIQEQEAIFIHASGNTKFFTSYTFLSLHKFNMRNTYHCTYCNIRHNHTSKFIHSTRITYTHLNNRSL